MLFELGRVVATPSAVEAMAENNIDLSELLIRHVVRILLNVNSDSART